MSDNTKTQDPVALQRDAFIQGAIWARARHTLLMGQTGGAGEMAKIRYPYPVRVPSELVQKIVSDWHDGLSMADVLSKYLPELQAVPRNTD